jgi:serine protease Do
VAATLPGSDAKVEVVRDGRERMLTVRLGEAATSRAARPAAGGAGSDDRTALGITVTPLTPELAARAGLDGQARGVLVRDVDPDGRAALVGIRTGDIIQEVNRRAVATPDDLRSELLAATGRPALLLVNRDGRTFFVPVKPTEPS